MRQSISSATVLLAAIAVLPLACSDGGAGASKSNPGEKLYFEKGCTACHGARGEGTFMGPALRQLGSHWKREELARFLLDPSPVARADARLAELMKRYRTPMAPIAASESERLAIAEWVLAFE